MKNISTTLTRTSERPPDVVYPALIHCDAVRVFRPVGALPGVAAVQLHNNRWGHQGDTRTITLTDGSTAHEALTAVIAPDSFTYTVSAYTSVLRLLVSRGESTFTCSPTTSGGTLITWTYAYTPRSALVRPLVWLVRVLLWEHYMTAAFDRALSDIS
jgi:hypothetical protein